MEDGVAFLAQGAECEWNGAVAQLDVVRLAHNVVGIGDNEVGEPTVVLFEPFGALGVGLAGHLRTKVGELLAELLNLGLGFEMLEGAADGRVGETDGDGAEGAGIQLGMSLHDIERALGREGVVVSMDTIDDFTLFGVGVWGDGEAWACGSVDGLGGQRARGGSADWFGIGRIDGSRGWFHERDSGGTELCLCRDDLDAAAEDVDRGRHVVVV